MYIDHIARGCWTRVLAYSTSCILHMEATELTSDHVGYQASVIAKGIKR